VILAHGSRFGGYVLFIKDEKLHYVYNFLGIKREQQFVSAELKPGKHTLGTEFTRERAGEYHESLRTTNLYLNESLPQRQDRGDRADAKAAGQIHTVP